ncbi:MAG: ABC transporter permease [Clostridiales bacterium]|nr:ABC transporter permease [Clostridiales bacterium]
MNSVDVLRMAYGNLFRRKMRAILTIVGVFIGTMAIVVMMSLGIGLQESTTKQMESWGDINNITVNQGRSWNPETGEYMGEEQRLNDDAVALIKSQPGVLAVMPSIQVGGQVNWGKKQGWFSLYGVDPEIFNQMNYEIAGGRRLRKADTNAVLVGWQVINQFWDPDDTNYWMRWSRENQSDSTEMIGEVVYVTLNNNYMYEMSRKQPLTVVGVLEGEFKDHAYSAYAPIETLQKWRDFVNDKSYMTQEQRQQQEQWEKEMKERGDFYYGRDPTDYDQILVRCKDVKTARAVAASLREVGYNLWTVADYMEGVENQALIIQAVLGGIGGITLLVASIGIANTMIMAIYERTREIGVMKVIGATGGDVMKMFLMEAGLIGVCGGVLGLACSLGISRLINYLAGDFFGMGMGYRSEQYDISVIPPYLMLFALVFAFLIGIIAGLYPARRASKLSPILAIRNE